MSVWNTPVREIDTFRSMFGVQNIPCTLCLSAVFCTTPTQAIHTREEEIEQMYESLPQATSFNKPNTFEERFKKIYGKHPVEVGSSALVSPSQTPRGEPLGDPSLILYVNLSRSTSRMAEPEQMACPSQGDETSPDETIVAPQNLSAFSEYSNTVLRA